MQKGNDLSVILLLALAYFLFFSGSVGPAGPATIFVAFEEDSKYLTTEFADLRTDLVTGAPGKPFYDKGHRFLFIDNDTDNSVVKRFAPYQDETPEVIVFSGEKLKARFPTTYKATAEELATALHGKGL
jgi:hypothetical protein